MDIRDAVRACLGDLDVRIAAALLGAAAGEREACARLVESNPDLGPAGADIAAAIRARGK